MNRGDRDNGATMTLIALSSRLSQIWTYSTKHNSDMKAITGTGHLDLNSEGYSLWQEADTTHTDNEELKPTDTSNNNEWPYHVSLAHGKEFIYVTNVEKFYKKYSYVMGFSMRKDRNIKECDIAQVQSLRSVGVKTSQVMDHQLDQSGSDAVVGHTREDLQNRLDSIRRSGSYTFVVDSIISYMTVKAEMDQAFLFLYSILEDGSMGNLFWSDKMSRCDYRYFGNVISFNSTYRTNVYNQLLVIFVGVNHHMKTEIFRFGLLVDEIVGTYRWILQTFLEVMHGKCLITIVTDGDKAMSKAIRAPNGWRVLMLS
ncbi:hypothetical protein Ddye_028764 [Dipteronia dyeriana]|uniref:MULE transposase domain-containing protein n=1 Tax=Dipteronia dyeriana TaxID=168575 RepID=A0AAD9TDX8_9ROSI|nr:hypothetical protein Ddye_028764 [Dipteronia dyeriana]